MTTVRELIDLYNGGYGDNVVYINNKRYEKPIYDHLQVLGFETDYEYDLWIDVDPKDKKEVDNNNCNNPFD